jgi:parvulin-like peptidyl-prolyl isomerase
MTTLDKWFKDTDPKLAEELSDAETRNDQALVEKLRQEMRKDYEAMLQQTLARQNMTMAEFDLLMEANANLRKVIEKQVAGKVTEENIREAFNLLYGENVRIRHIQCTNMTEIGEVQRRLAAGESFEAVAKALSRNAQTRGLGGELPPFSRQTPNLPDMFKQVAFSLKNPGEVSDPVEANGAYHLIKLVERIAPKAVKYEDVKGYVRDQLYDRWVIEKMKAYRDELAKRALEGLKISDPVLAKQFADRLARRESELKERDQISREIARERDQNERQNAEPTTVPSVLPGPAAATRSTSSTEELRPPATQSGSDTPDHK